MFVASLFLNTEYLKVTKMTFKGWIDILWYVNKNLRYTQQCRWISNALCWVKDDWPKRWHCTKGKIIGGENKSVETGGGVDLKEAWEYFWGDKAVLNLFVEEVTGLDVFVKNQRII